MRNGHRDLMVDLGRAGCILHLRVEVIRIMDTDIPIPIHSDMVSIRILIRMDMGTKR